MRKTAGVKPKSNVVQTPLTCHLKELHPILDDAEASENAKFIVRAFSKSSDNTAALGVCLR